MNDNKQDKENWEEMMRELRKELAKTKKELTRQVRKYKKVKVAPPKAVSVGSFSIMREDSGIIRLLLTSEFYEKKMIEWLQDMGGEVI